jgi:hypothetical protein
MSDSSSTHSNKHAPKQPLGASFRDPSGFLFTTEGSLYRQINNAYHQDYHRLMASDLYSKLVSTGLLIPHQEVDVEPANPELAYKIIQPEPITFISYPYEWSFSQLQNAALTTLKIQKIALEHGMSLKDSSAYNIQFHQGHPVLIDTLSFEIYQEGKPWDAYRQFCQHFLAPLSLMAYRDVRLSQLLRVYIDGIPLDLASELLPWRTRLNPALLFHIHSHAASQKRYASKTAKTSRQMSKIAFQGLLDNLEAGIKRLKWIPSGTEWGNYYEDHNYLPMGLKHKQKLVTDFLEYIRPTSVWDLGANAGIFSRLASQSGIPSLAFDVDHGAVEKNYQQCVAEKEKYLLPLFLDLTNPSPAIGWHNRERLSLLERAPADAVLALALIHHLAISNNVPLNRLASFFQSAGSWLIIEFVPKSDSQVQRLLASRQDIFSDFTIETFERIFAKKFSIVRNEAIEGSQRRLYLMKRQ